MRGREIIAAIVGLMCPAAALAADEPLRLAPSSNWVLDYADDSCALRRAFRSGGDQVVMELRQFAPGDTFQIVLASETLSRNRPQARLRFEPDEGFFAPYLPALAKFGGNEGVIFRDSRGQAGDTTPGAVVAGGAGPAREGDHRSSRCRHIQARGAPGNGSVAPADGGHARLS